LAVYAVYIAETKGKYSTLVPETEERISDWKFGYRRRIILKRTKLVRSLDGATFFLTGPAV
jgi:hypothetical protein